MFGGEDSSSNTISTIIKLNTEDPQSVLSFLYSWESAGNWASPRRGVQSITLGNNIYLIGGYLSDGKASNLVSVYDTTTGTMTENVVGLSLSKAKKSVASVVVGDSIYLFGGSTDQADTNVW